MSGLLPRYPVYVISKGRWETPLTANFLKRDGVPFRIVVEPQEADLYREAVGEEYVLVLPFSNLGQGSIPARNWCWEHSISEGHERHWILDDNMRRVYRSWRKRRIPCDSGPAFAALEDFTDRYENLAITGMAYKMFALQQLPAIHINCHVYSCLLIMNGIEQRWRGRYNEDTDLCLQVLSAGYCTVLCNVFSVDKIWTMQMKGGNTDELYAGDGRLRMARSLERQWPGVVTVDRRWGRPQHRVAHEWKRFDTQLRLKPDAVIPEGPHEYGLQLTATRPPRSKRIRALLDA